MPIHSATSVFTVIVISLLDIVVISYTFPRKTVTVIKLAALVPMLLRGDAGRIGILLRYRFPREAWEPE